MCLDTMRRLPPTPEEKKGWGWKVFTDKRLDYGYGEKQWLFAVFSITGFRRPSKTARRAVPLDRWLKAVEVDIRSTSGYHYTSGFHIYLRKPRYVSSWQEAVPVQYRKAHTIGTQDGKPIIVAKEMFVAKPKPQKGK